MGRGRSQTQATASVAVPSQWRQFPCQGVHVQRIGKPGCLPMAASGSHRLPCHTLPLPHFLVCGVRVVLPLAPGMMFTLCIQNNTARYESASKKKEKKKRKERQKELNSAAEKILQAPMAAKINSKDRLLLSKGDTEGFC